jgi:mevalonate kinase
LKSAFELRNEAVSQISEVWEENPELAKQFLQKVNEKFTEEGIKLINQEEFE